MADKTDTASSLQQSLQRAFSRLFADFLAMRRVLHSQCSDRWAVYLNDARKVPRDEAKAERLAGELIAQIRCDTPSSAEAVVQILIQLHTQKGA